MRTTAAISNVGYAENSCDLLPIANPQQDSCSHLTRQALPLQEPPSGIGRILAVVASTTASMRPMPEGDGIVGREKMENGKCAFARCQRCEVMKLDLDQNLKIIASLASRGCVCKKTS